MIAFDCTLRRSDFTFEADNFVMGIPEELLPQAYKYMHDTGRFLIQKCVSEE